ncbi:MAG: protease complex subunit PrcB family protein [Spirochaetales bacterium]|nr:MAG: protease complex subunit PrcB family protein [Spirochaetales bacterium]
MHHRCRGKIAASDGVNTTCYRQLALFRTSHEPIPRIGCGCILKEPLVILLYMKFSLRVAATLSLIALVSCVGQIKVHPEKKPETVSSSSHMVPTVIDSLEYDVLGSGSHASVTDGYTTLIRNPDAFNRLWSSILGSSMPAPDIDFGVYAVIASFMGQRNTGGFSVQPVRVELLSDDRVRVVLRNEAPRKDQVVTQVLTSPYVILAVPVGQADVLVMFEDN